MDNDAFTFIGLCTVCGFAWLMFQRWFWLLAFGLAGLASGFTVLASIIHFQILGAVGFFILTCIFVFLTAMVAEGAT